MKEEKDNAIILPGSPDAIANADSVEIDCTTGKRVLIVGAGGFVGGYLVEEGLRRGYEVWAGIRSTTSRRRLADPRIKIVEFDFDTPGITLAYAARCTSGRPVGLHRV